QGRHQVLSQAAQGTGVRAPGGGHGQAGELRRGPPAADPWSGASPLEVSEQPGGEFPPADPSTRTSDEEVQLSRWRAAILVRIQCDIATLSATASPAPRQYLPPRDGRPLQYLERSHWPDRGCLNHPRPDRLSRPQSAQGDLLGPFNQTSQHGTAGPFRWVRGSSTLGRDVATCGRSRSL